MWKCFNHPTVKKLHCIVDDALALPCCTAAVPPFQVAYLPAPQPQAAADEDDLLFHRDNTRGSGGKPIETGANYIKLETVPRVVINEFTVRFDPPVDSR